MRFPFFTILLVGALSNLVSPAQENIVQTFNGTTALTTPSFKVQDNWEVRWDASDLIVFTIFSSDGAIVAGTASSKKGSLYQPKGGTFYLQINGNTADPKSSWHVSIVEIKAGMTTNQTALSSNYIPPQLVSPPGPTNTISIPASPSVSTGPATENLSEDQVNAVVVIKGDYAEGTGFLVKTADGPAVMTNLHVIAANPNMKILTTTGAQIKTLALKGATDRDMAMFLIQDDHYTYLELATDIKDTVEEGDEVITPGNSQGGHVVLDTTGRVIGIGPDQIEFSNPVYHGNSGGPVIQTKSGKVIAIVTEAKKVNILNEVDKASFENTHSAIIGTMRYFGLRQDTVPKWEAYDWNRFQNETTFLKNFHELNRCLDSYLNGAYYEKAHLTNADGQDGAPNSHYYLTNEKIETAQDNYRNSSANADKSQQLDAARELIMNLEGIVDTDMNVMESPDNFYSYDQVRAAQEVQYRKALRAEIEKFGSKISDRGH